jgi:riboflavin synthase
MFTGIITAVGAVQAMSRENGVKLTLSTPFATGDVAIGASLACNGICLTVTEKGPKTLSFEASEETLERTTLGAWAEGTPVNLERSLKAGDELGGHMVMGHIDGISEISAIEPIEGGQTLTLTLPGAITHLVAEKGSIALDGVSLTVNRVGPEDFSVAIIPHTRAATTFKGLKTGDKVNVEADVFARYSARLQEVKGNS